MSIDIILPTDEVLETGPVLKAAIAAHRYLAELKGLARVIPNEEILISTLAMQEAQSSSEIENIITTQDALYKYQLLSGEQDPAAKEVAHYADGLQAGFRMVKEQGVLSMATIMNVQAILEGNNAGLRKIPGTILKNETSGAVIYEPPPPDRIPEMMSGLVTYIHRKSAVDPLIRMAVIHHQFESIHPFYDGNGRTGRIINILFLVKEGLLDTPILYLSRYINQTRSVYYHLLQQVREQEEWEDWLVYMLRGVARTARDTIGLVKAIQELLQRHKQRIRQRHKFYSQELINNLFHHPYTKVAFLEADLGVSRATAARYLDALAADGILHKHRLGRENYYVNHALTALLFNLPSVNS